MTNAQERTIERLRKDVEKYTFFSKDGSYEFKEWEVEEMKCGQVSLIFETGMINDEGTLADIFCRERGHVFIGKKGGITYYCNSKRGKYIEKRFDIRRNSILQITIDQR